MKDRHREDRHRETGLRDRDMDRFREVRSSETVIFKRFREIRGSETVIFKGSCSRDPYFYKVKFRK